MEFEHYCSPNIVVFVSPSSTTQLIPDTRYQTPSATEIVEDRVKTLHDAEYDERSVALVT